MVMIVYVCPSLRHRNSQVIPFIVSPFSKPCPLQIQLVYCSG